MLNENLVLDYVKAELGFPFQPLEFEEPFHIIRPKRKKWI